MSNKQQTQAQPEHKNGRKPELVVVNEQVSELAGVAELPGGLAAAGDAQAQAARLGDARLQTIQRQRMAKHIGQMQGNQHLQRIIQAATHNNAAQSSAPKGNGNGHHAESVTAEADFAGDADGLGAGGPRAFVGVSTPPNGNGNGNSHHAIQREETSANQEPTEAEKAAAKAAAQAARAQAQQAQSVADQETGKANTASSAEKQVKETAKAKGDAAKAEAQSIPKGPPVKGAAPAPKPVNAAPQGMIGGAAPTPASVEGGKAPASPEEDPGFNTVVGKAKATSAKEKTHEPAATKAEQAQGAAVPPAGEVTSKAQAGQVGAMESTETPAFDKAAFKAKLMQKIEAMTPKTAEEADNFKSGGKAGAIKGELTGEVDQQKQASQGPLKEKAAAAPDTGGIKPKPVTPLTPETPGEAPASLGAEAAAPKPKGQSELETPLKQQSQSVDQQMAEADVSEDQLAKSNEPEFTGALASKKEAQTQAEQSPKEYRQFEGEQVAKAKSEAEAVATEKTQAMHATRTNALTTVEGQQGQAKTQDEQKRAQIAADIQKIYDNTKTKVEGILTKMDQDVNQAFDAGAAAAKQAFENYIDSETEAYKQDRYGGWLGWARWIEDKFKADPEINRIAERGKALFIKEMDAVINNVVEIVARGMTEAKAEIANGKKEIQTYVEKLPADLQQVGQQAAGDVQSQFDELEASVNSKQDELVDSLANKYKENLDAVNARVEAIKEANKGLIDRAVDAVAGVIRTIIELKNMLLNVLGRVADAVGKIIKDPIGFLGNLVNAIKQGFSQFVGNIGTHLKKGLIAWLTGSIAEAGITLPESFDLKGIFQLVMQILGVSFQQIMGKVSNVLGFDVLAVYDQIMQLVTIYQEQGLVGLAKFGLEKLIGEQGVAALMEVVKIFNAIKSGDWGQLWAIIQEHLASLKEMVMSKIQEFIAERVIKAGITWLISLFNPAGAFIKACKMIYDVVMFFVERGSQIMSLVNAVIDSVGAIASGNIGAAANFVEQSLAKAIPVAISFLSSLLGLGNISGKVKEIITSVRSTVDKAIDSVLNSKPVQLVAGFIKKAVSKVKAFVKGGVEKVKGAFSGKGKEEKVEDDKRSSDDKQKALDAGLKQTESLMNDPKSTPESVRNQLPTIKQQYGLKSLTLVHENELKYHTEGIVALQSSDSKELHSDYRPENLKITNHRDGTQTISYSTPSGQKFAVKLDENEMVQSVTGTNLELKEPGTRGYTGRSGRFVSNMDMNAAHLIADRFKGSGYKEAANLISTSDHYNKQVMGATEEEIVSFIEQNGATVFNMKVSVKWVKLDDGRVRKSIEKEFGSNVDIDDAIGQLQAASPNIQRCSGVTYNVTLKDSQTNTKTRQFMIGPDIWLGNT